MQPSQPHQPHQHVRPDQQQQQQPATPVVEPVATSLVEVNTTTATHDLSPPLSPSNLSATPPLSPQLSEQPSPLSDSDDHSTPSSPKENHSDKGLLDSDSSCVVCFERPSNVKLDPCGHANLCDVCVSRLVKRRCPTCRARARKVIIRMPGGSEVIKAVRDIIAERKQRESKVLEDTLQVVFLGPEKVGKKTLVTKLMSKYPLPGAPSEPLPLEELFSDGTDFSPNSFIGGMNVRLTVLRRTNLTSRRMILDDVRVLKPDVLVLCCSSHVSSTFDLILNWDKILRNNLQKPRVWACLTNDGLDSDPTTIDVKGAISAISPPDLRPKAHYFCSTGDHFSVGFRSLAKDIVTMGRIARDEELANSIALEEARNLADHEAAGTLADHAAANLVIANNGIGVPPSSHSSSNSHRANNSNSRHHHHGVGRTFSLRGFRDRGNHGQGLSLSNLIAFNWFASSNES
ncbi:P-loop containing nucleoside triphosphate hydrolase [Gracilaria domingensis]|nr:P-loop containing nucleoside triphosphate hydrolase [Gracilaria domingensis]